MSGYYGPSGATATGSLNSTTITIAGGDVAPILPGMMIYFGSRTVADGPGYLIAAVVRTDASNGTITLSSGLATAQSSQPFLVDLSQAGNASTYASFSLSRVINALGEFLGLGTTVDATTKQIVLNKATSGAISRILFEIAGADQFRHEQTAIGGVEHFVIQSSNDGGTNWVNAIAVRRTDGRVSFAVSPVFAGPLRALAGSAAAPAFTFDLDPDTGAFNPAANVYAIATNATERVRVNGNGNVGIGTTTPAARFHTVGTVLFQGDSGSFFDGVSLQHGGDDSVERISFIDVRRSNVVPTCHLFFVHQTNGGSHIAVATTPAGSIASDRRVEVVRITDAGSVGVGTTAPSTRLHVFGAGGNGGGARFQSTNSFCGIQIDGVDDAGINDTTFIRMSDSAGDSFITRTGLGTGTPGDFRISHGGAERLRILAGGTVRPGGDNTQSLGSASFRWSTVFAGTGTINTSDARQKVKRGHFTDAELDSWADIQPLIFRWKDSVERKGDAARRHAGYIAQEVAAAFEAHGLDAGDYGLWCEDPVTKTVKRTVTRHVQKTRKVSVEVLEVEIRNGKPVQVRKMVEREEPETEMVEVRDEAGLVVRDSDGKPLMHPVPVMENREVEETEEVPDGTRLGLRYDQCAVFEAAWARREIERLRARIAALEA